MLGTPRTLTDYLWPVVAGGWAACFVGGPDARQNAMADMVLPRGDHTGHGEQLLPWPRWWVGAVGEMPSGHGCAKIVSMPLRLYHPIRFSLRLILKAPLSCLWRGVCGYMTLS